MNKVPRPIKNSLAIIFGIFSAILAFTILSQFSVNTIDRIIIHGKFKSDLQLQTTLVSPSDTKRILETTINASIENDHIRIGSGRFNYPSKTIRLDFIKTGEITEPIYLNIYYIEIRLPYVQKIEISQKHLRKYFSSDEFLNDNSPILKIDPHTNLASLKLLRPISEIALNTLPLLHFFALALLIGFSIFLLIRYTRWSDIPAFSDLSLGRHISSTSEFDAINGLRGLAAILVVFSHTAPGFFDINVGISLLFILSGFLLSKPFILDSNKIYSWKNIEIYLVKRLRRILPMYYLFIFVTYVVSMEFETAVRHFLFIEAANHLWPMTQIFTFYMLLPLVMLITCAMHNINRWLPIVSLIIAILLYMNFSEAWKPYYNGRYHKQFYLYAFLMGVLGSYFHYGFIRGSKKIELYTEKYSNSVGLIAAGLTLATIVWSAPITPPDALRWYFSNFQFKCVLSAMIVILNLNACATWFMSIISNWLFRSIGVVGFSFYLLHALGMQIVLEFQREFLGIMEPLERSWTFAISVLLITYLMALISYSYIERPFFGYRKKTN